MTSNSKCHIFVTSLIGDGASTIANLFLSKNAPVKFGVSDWSVGSNYKIETIQEGDIVITDAESGIATIELSKPETVVDVLVLVFSGKLTDEVKQFWSSIASIFSSKRPPSKFILVRNRVKAVKAQLQLTDEYKSQADAIFGNTSLSKSLIFRCATPFDLEKFEHPSNLLGWFDVGNDEAVNPEPTHEEESIICEHAHCRAHVPIQITKTNTNQRLCKQCDILWYALSAVDANGRRVYPSHEWFCLQPLQLLRRLYK